MAIDYAEKRNYIRMRADSHMSIRANSGNSDTREGRCHNLSASGMLFSTTEPYAAGTVLQVNITPSLAVVPPLDATVEVIRVAPGENSDYEIAATIKRIN